MSEEHPLEKLLREEEEAKQLQVGIAEKLRQDASEVEQKSREEWPPCRERLQVEVAAANAALERHKRPQRFAFQEVPQPGQGNIARGMITLNGPYGTLATHDLQVTADGRVQVGGYRTRLIIGWTNQRWEDLLSDIFKNAARANA